MRQDRGEGDDAGSLIDGGGLHGRNLMLAQDPAHDVEPAGQRRIAERAFDPATRALGSDGGHQRLLGVGQFGLSPGQRSGNRADRLARALHGFALPA